MDDISTAEEPLSELEQSALEEIVNILVGAYLSAIHSMTDLSVRPEVPQITVDMVGAIVSVATIEYGQVGDSMLFLKTQFRDVEKEMAGHFFLIPDFSSYKILIESLGLES
jgi:chemotaxis protein CheC